MCVLTTSIWQNHNLLYVVCYKNRHAISVSNDIPPFALSDFIVEHPLVMRKNLEFDLDFIENYLLHVSTY